MNKKLLQGWNLITLGFLTLLLYLIVAWFVQNPAAFITPDEGGKFLQLQNLAFVDGNLTYDLPYRGQSLDPDLRFAPQNEFWGLRVRDGKLYFNRFSLLGLLVRPFFDLFGFPGLYLIPALCGVACSLLTILLLDPEERRLEMWLLIAFGSPVFIYSVLFWEHTLAVALGLLAIWLAVKKKAINHNLSWLGIGLALGLSVIVRLEMAIFALAFLAVHLYVVPNKKRGPLIALGLLVTVVLTFLSLNLVFYGQPWPDNSRYLFFPFNYFRQVGWLAVKDLLVGPSAEGAIDTGWLGGLWTIAAVIAIAHSFTENRTISVQRLRTGGVVVTMVIAVWFLFDSTNYYSAHGLLFTTPWVLLGVIRTKEIWQQGERHHKIIVGTVLTGLIGYTINIIGLRASSPHGGLEWGARYALVYYPLLALLAGWHFKGGRQHTLNLLITGGMIFLGLAFQIRGVWANRQSKALNEELYALIQEQPDEHIVFNEWWLPLNAAPIYEEKRFYVVPTARELATWSQLANQNDIYTFSLVTTNPSLIEEANDELSAWDLEILTDESFGQIVIYRLFVQEQLAP